MADAPAQKPVVRLEVPERGDADLMEWFQNIKVFGNGDVVYVEPDFTLFNAFEVMQENRIVAIPIWDPMKRDCTGQVEMFDLVKAAVDAIPAEKEENVVLDATNEALDIACSNYVGQGSYTTVEDGCSLAKCLELLQKRRCRRVYITTEGACVGILSDSWFLRWLNAQDIGELPQTISGLGLGWAGRDGIDVTPASDSAFAAFRGLATQGRNAVGLIDKDGKLVGSLCVTDLKAAVSERELSWNLLAMSAEDFRARSSRMALWSRRGQFYHLGPRTVGLADVKNLRGAFRDMDLDGDGHIDAEELAAALEKAGEPCSTDVVSELIRKVDVNKNGKIEFDEFVVMAELIRKGDLDTLQERFKEGFENMITVLGEDSLRHAISVLAVGRVHQIFVVSEDFVPIRMVSPSDIIDALEKVCLIAKTQAV